MPLNVHKHRKGLARTRKRLTERQLTIGFVGGSITDGRVDHNWPDPVIAWFIERFPHLRMIVENAAISGTGSDLAVFRARRDLIERGCDLVFIEFAVNDEDELADRRLRTREGLIRKLLAGDGCDLVLTYTFSQSMYADMIEGRMPASIADFERLAEHYGIGSAWMGLHALREVQAGRMRWEEWLPDGLHPRHRGSLSYAQSVIAFLERELITQPSAGAIPVGGARPQALHPSNWEHAAAVLFSDVTLHGPWVVRRWPNYPWIDQMFDTSAVGAKMGFRFEGRGVLLAFDFGKQSSEFRYKLDDADWIAVTRDRPVWCEASGWLRSITVADDLPNGSHFMEIEVVHGNRPECTGTNFRLGLIGIVK